MKNLYLNPVSFSEARSKIGKVLCDVEDQTKAKTIVRVSSPLVAPTAFKCSDIHANIGNERKEAYRFMTDKGDLLLTTGGKTFPLNWASYIMADRKSGDVYFWSSASPEDTDPGILLFERKKRSIRFGLITQNGTELTWEDDTVFMFLGSAEFEEHDPMVVFAAGVGGSDGFGGLVFGSDPNIRATAVGAYSALLSIMPNLERKANEVAADYEE